MYQTVEGWYSPNVVVLLFHNINEGLSFLLTAMVEEEQHGDELCSFVGPTTVMKAIHEAVNFVG